MKVLWLCNIPLPIIADQCNLPKSNTGGWLTGLARDLLRSNAVELTVCFPVDRWDKLIEGRAGELTYFGFPRKISDPAKYDASIEPYLAEIVKKVMPDLIHIWGTEFPHTLAMTRVFPYPNKMVISIQGLCNIISIHYYANLPYKIINANTLRDFLRHDNINQQRKKFEKRGKFELQALKNVGYAMGRTAWDRTCANNANSNIRYCFCNETLRDNFYNFKWDINECEKYSIFYSQGGYPIKGLHFVLQALPQIITEFPKTHLYIAGQNIVFAKKLSEKLRQTYYGKYLYELIKNLKIENYITFTGPLNEKEMCKRMKKSHVFLSASSIENSPNSLGEAMLLGVPCVSSDVGGVADMLVHKEEGFVYPADEYYMISHYVTEIFKSDDLALQFSQNARIHAQKTHNRENNLKTVLEIYSKIMIG